MKLLEREASSSSSPELPNLLMISYYNLGVEFEYLKDYALSCQAYSKGAQLAGKAQRGKDMLPVLQENATRTQALASQNERRLVALLEKRRELDEKGGYEGMRRNKKR